MDRNTKNRNKPKVLAVASFGGHLVQLKRMVAGIQGVADVAWVSTVEKGASGVDGEYYRVADFSRRSPWMMFAGAWRMVKAVRRSSASCVISTGAAPGLIAIVVARLMGKRTLWIDSMANAERLSMCGRIATFISSETLTQWPHLQTKRVGYAGAVL